MPLARLPVETWKRTYSSRDSTAPAAADPDGRGGRGGVFGGVLGPAGAVATTVGGAARGGGEGSGVRDRVGATDLAAPISGRTE